MKGLSAQISFNNFSTQSPGYQVFLPLLFFLSPGQLDARHFSLSRASLRYRVIEKTRCSRILAEEEEAGIFFRRMKFPKFFPRFFVDIDVNETSTTLTSVTLSSSKLLFCRTPLRIVSYSGE